MGDVVKIHFGVIDHPYAYVRQLLSKKGKPLKRGQKVELSTTTGEVAERLEERYAIFENFYARERQYIEEQIMESLEGAAESLLSGAPPTHDPFGAATSAIEDRVKRDIMNNAFDWNIPGVPTAASGRVPAIRQGGVNHRLAHPYSKDNPPRPSFVDTGNFEASIKVWIE